MVASASASASASESLTAAIGERVKHVRQQRQWTLDQLAEASGVSRRQIVSVEQGDANPSLATLLRISDALGIGLPALVEPPHATPRVDVTRAGAGAQLWTGPSGGAGVLVAGTEAPDVVELWDWSLAPGEVHRSEAHAAGTRELLQVRSGSLQLTVGDETVTLARGDAAAFVGDVEHSYANPGRTATVFTLAVFEPHVGASAPPGNRP